MYRFSQSMLVGFAAAILTAVFPLEASNLITNGDFTVGNPAIPNNQAGYWALPVSNGGLGLPSGWNVNPNGSTTALDCVVTNNTASLVTSSSGDICGTAENQNWGFNYSVQTPPGGGNYFAMDASGSYNGPLYQTISALTIGQQYVLTFNAAADQQNGYSQSITSNWGVDAYAGSAAPPLSFSGYTSVGASLTPSNNEAWTQETYVFSATSATETIAFLANSPETTGPPFALLSQVQLTASTPEPGTLLLLGLGLLALRALRRRPASG
jgi:hypothetical protein